MSVDFKVSDFAYPVGILRLRRFLERSQWLPPEELTAYQEKRLRLVVRQAYHHVPYYRRIFDANRLSPHDIRSVQDLARLPSLSRETARGNYRQLCARNAHRFRPAPAHTSGTTGTPLRFLVDRPSNILEFVYYWRHWSWAGYRLGDCVANLRYDYFVRQEETADHAWRYQHHLRRLLLNSLRVSPERVVEYARALRKYRPKFIHGRPASLYTLALFLRDRKMDDISFQAVFAAGENLLPQYREAIERTFSCKVLDSYGHMERSIAISQCSDGGYHVNSEYGILELGDPKAIEVGVVRGPIICTSLHKMAMPFLRYEVDDSLDLYTDGKRCPCGRSLPLVKRIDGRKEDVICAPDGRRIPSLFNVFYRVQGIRFFQMVQEKIDQLTVRIVRGQDYTSESEGGLRFWLARFIGDGLKIRLEYVSEADLVKDKSGKLRPVMSQVLLSETPRRSQNGPTANRR